MPSHARAYRVANTTSPSGELIIYDWPDDLPQDVLDDFTAEFGVRIQYLTYGNQEQAVDDIRAGKVYDLVVMSNELLARLASEKLLAEIDYSKVLNFRNVSPNFHDLAYNPQNRHSIPFNWGIVGIMVRPDLLKKPIQHWADLWDPEFTGKIVTWRTPHAVIGAGLKGLGYSINSSDPAEYAAARQRLLALRPRFILMKEDDYTLANYLISGEAAVALAFARDVSEAQKRESNIQFILPAEGTMLWGDNFVIPANAPNQAAAHAFLNYLLRPEIRARLVAYNLYPTPNDAALAFNRFRYPQ